jgi:hypothetical protein
MRYFGNQLFEVYVEVGSRLSRSSTLIEVVLEPRWMMRAAIARVPETTDQPTISCGKGVWVLGLS